MKQFSLAGWRRDSCKFWQVQRVPSTHRVLKHFFFLVTMRRVQGLASSEVESTEV